MGPLIGGTIATALSLCIFSRVLGSNPAYRFAQSVLVGIALGYAAALVLRSTLVPAVESLAFGQRTPFEMTVTGVGLVFGLLLLTRYGRQRASFLANYPLAILFGVGSALALSGAVRGTLVPQMLGMIRSAGSWTVASTLDDLLGIGLSIVLTLVTLASFRYASRRAADAAGGIAQPVWAVRSLQGAGRILVLAAFGVFFAATVQTYLAALVGQIAMINEWAGVVWMWISGT